jgi:hypothetical protein
MLPRLAIVVFCIVATPVFAGPSETRSSGVNTRPDDGRLSADSKKPVARFRVSLPKKEFRNSESIWVEYLLVNDGSENLWINNRMSSGPSNEATELYEVSLQIVDKANFTQKYSCLDKREIASAHNYQILRPTESVAIRKYIYCFHLKPGDYVIKARYQDGNLDYPLPPFGAEHLTARLVAPPVAFRIVGGEGGK